MRRMNDEQKKKYVEIFLDSLIKTYGRPLDEWMDILDRQRTFKSSYSAGVRYLQQKHGMQYSHAHYLIDLYLRSR